MILNEKELEEGRRLLDMARGEPATTELWNNWLIRRGAALIDMAAFAIARRCNMPPGHEGDLKARLTEAEEALKKERAAYDALEQRMRDWKNSAVVQGKRADQAEEELRRQKRRD